MRKTATVSIFLMISALIFGMAIFAKRLGLDPNPGWGKGRIVLLILGLVVAFIPWIIRRQSPALDKTIQTDLFTLPVLLAVVGIYFGFIFVSHDSSSNYYSLLATSFRNGELSLPLKPDPALLQLPNPYDPAARQGIKAPVDVSLYKGKFYLYWGPAPSMLLAVAQPFLPKKLSEADLLFVFIVGVFLSEFILIMNLWEQFFSNLPKWILLVSIFLVGLANPTLWLLSQPKIYETAIAGGQFFFIAGFVSAVLALEHESPSRWRLALAGTLWALAVGTRSVLLFPIIFMAFLVVYHLFKNRERALLKLAGQLIALGVPLFIGAVGFGWYNWARFGSILETGFTYQLAGPYLQQHLNEIFSPKYIIQNLHNYLLNPFVADGQFPFIHAVRGSVEEILPSQSLPFYLAQSITGLLFSAPFIVFAVITVVIFFKQRYMKDPADDLSEQPRSSLIWIVSGLLGSFVLSFLSLLTFFWSAMRYMEDFMPPLVLLSVIGFFYGYELVSQSPDKRRLYSVISIVVASVSSISGILLAISNYLSVHNQ